MQLHPLGPNHGAQSLVKAAGIDSDQYLMNFSAGGVMLPAVYNIPATGNVQVVDEAGTLAWIERGYPYETEE